MGERDILLVKYLYHNDIRYVQVGGGFNRATTVSQISEKNGWFVVFDENGQPEGKVNGRFVIEVLYMDPPEPEIRQL